MPSRCFPLSLHAARLSPYGAILALCALTAAAAAPAPSTSAQFDPAVERFEFDIPAQPLVDALRRYASLTRQPTLFASDLVNGRASTAVHGQYSSEAGLHRLLDGTGLTAEQADADVRAGFVLKAIDSSVVAPRAGLGSLAGYPSLIQSRVWDALCADARTAPGAYRSLLRFQVDATGQIQRPRLLGSTGDIDRDTALLAILQDVRMEGPPPPDLPQPVTMLILPRDADSTDGPYCRDGAQSP